KTCCFTGHRILKKDFLIEQTRQEVLKLLNKNYQTFLVGMAKGYDIECLKMLLSLKKEYNLEIIACIPCKNQPEKLTDKEKQEYNNLLLEVDQKIYLEETYKAGCMQKRNRFMVDNSSTVIVYKYVDKGGTFYTETYAKKNNKEIIYV
ncbi:MAG: DUF1273 family protein, partial [Clostridia bacterium]|nr:DUF1273 family protein [Clostridia bacterium]